MPGKSGTTGMPDMPVASTRWRGLSTCTRPSRSTSTSHSPFASSKRARRQVVEARRSISITLAYISSQSAIWSFGEKTGQWSGKGM